MTKSRGLPPPLPLFSSPLLAPLKAAAAADEVEEVVFLEELTAAIFSPPLSLGGRLEGSLVEELTDVIIITAGAYVLVFRLVIKWH